APSRSAVDTAAAAPPPISPTNANCEAPVNISTDRAQVWGAVRPAATASAPNESPYAPVAAPIPSASRTIGRICTAEYAHIARIWCVLAASASPELASSTMDSVDRAILSHLQDDGRLTNVELAERVRLSPSATLRRVRNLEATGAITGYHAVIDPDAV